MDGLQARRPGARRPAPSLPRADVVRVTAAAAASAFASALLAGAPRVAGALDINLPSFVKDSMGASADRPFDVGGGGRKNGKSGYLVRARAPEPALAIRAWAPSARNCPSSARA